MPPPEPVSKTLLVHHLKSSARIRRDLASRNAATWVYLGRDFRSLQRWESSLGPGFKRLDIAPRIHEASHRLRSPFLKYLRTLAEKHSSLEWWSSSISEANTLHESLFSRFLYVRIALDLLEQGEAPALIVAESRGVLENLRRLEPARTKASDPFGPVRNRLAFLILFARRWAAYFWRARRALRAARTTRKGPVVLPETSGRRTVLLHTCIDKNYFGENKANDTYFATLPDELRRRGFQVVILPWLYSPGRTESEAFRWFRERSGEYLIAEDFYGFWDYVWAAGVIMRQRRLPPSPQSFEGLDITPVIEEVRREQSANTSAAPFVLYVRLCERLAAAGFAPEIFIDMFENSLTEKPMALAMRRFMPNTRIVGFQHNCLPPFMLLHYFVVPDPAISPLPDVIVCNSEFSRKIFAGEGFPKERLRVGPSLRYQHLLGRYAPPHAEKNRVLVAVPLERSAATELMTLLLEAFPTSGDLGFWIKLHPLMSAEHWNDVLGGRALPPRMEVVPGRIGDWTRKATVAIVASSNAAFDLALDGVPLVQAGRPTTLDINPLEYFPEWPAPVCLPERLRAEVMKLLNLSASEREKLDAWVVRTRKDCLSPVNESTLSAFTDPVGNGDRLCAA